VFVYCCGVVPSCTPGVGVIPAWPCHFTGSFLIFFFRFFRGDQALWFFTKIISPSNIFLEIKLAGRRGAKLARKKVDGANILALWRSTKKGASVSWQRSFES